MEGIKDYVLRQDFLPLHMTPFHYTVLDSIKERRPRKSIRILSIKQGKDLRKERDT